MPSNIFKFLEEDKCFYHAQRVIVTTMLVARVEAGESLLPLRYSVDALPYVRSNFELYKYTLMRQIAMELLCYYMTVLFWSFR